MLTSLKVVNIAVSFFTATNRDAIFLRSILIFLLELCLSDRATPEEIAVITSCFVILPSLPVPLMSSVAISFSSINFFAATLGWPLAYESSFATGFDCGFVE